MRKLLATTLAMALTLSGCHGETEPVAGDLTEIGIETPAGAHELADFISVGTAHVTEPVAVFDAPDGSTIGRLNEGDLPIVSHEKGWIQVQLPTSEPASAWLSSQTVTITTNGSY